MIVYGMITLPAVHHAFGYAIVLRFEQLIPMIAHAMMQAVGLAGRTQHARIALAERHAINIVVGNGLQAPDVFHLIAVAYCPKCIVRQ